LRRRDHGGASRRPPSLRRDDACPSSRPSRRASAAAPPSSASCPRLLPFLGPASGAVTNRTPRVSRGGCRLRGGLLHLVQEIDVRFIHDTRSLHRLAQVLGLDERTRRVDVAPLQE